MSEPSSSCNSSELDDIQLAHPSHPTFETDVLSMRERSREYPNTDLRPTPRRSSPGPPRLPFKIGSVQAGIQDEETGTSLTLRESYDTADDTSDVRPYDCNPAATTFTPAHLKPQQGQETPKNTEKVALPAVMNSSQAGRVSVDLLSNAFVLDNRIWEQAAQQGYTAADVIIRRTCRGLGIDRQDLSFYELQSVGVDDMHAHGHYAVRIEKDGFSLRALEEAMSENMTLQLQNFKMQNHSEKCTASMDSLSALLQKFDEERSQLYLKSAEQLAEVRRLQERCRTSEGHTKLLKQQLARSDMLRSESQRQVDALKAEVLEMTRRQQPSQMNLHPPMTMPLSARRPSGANASPPVSYRPLSARGAPRESLMDMMGKHSYEGSFRHVSSNGASTRSNKSTHPVPMDRLAAVLERFGDPQTLARLEFLVSSPTMNGMT